MKRMAKSNPFALIKASDYTDKQINSYWVELGEEAVESVIEPRARVSKFILGGKGAGKTHLLRYYSYPVARMRMPEATGLVVIKQQGSIAVFLRATGIDAARFEASKGATLAWQQLFGVYLELRLVEVLIGTLIDVERTSEASFDFEAFLVAIGRTVSIPAGLEDLEALRSWVEKIRREIDNSVNNAAFTGSVDVRIPFSLGSLCLPISEAISAWCPSLEGMPLIYLIDEVENFSVHQQEVLNSLIRYGAGGATFRISGRLYAMQTNATLGGGEENREGSEFRTTNLDDLLRRSKRYPVFAKEFISKRLTASAENGEQASGDVQVDPEDFFAEVDEGDFYANVIKHLGAAEPDSHANSQRFLAALKDAIPESEAQAVHQALTDDVPLMLGALNILLFCKKWTVRSPWRDVTGELRAAAVLFLTNRLSTPSYYVNAYSHYSKDLLAQFFHASRSQRTVPYAGFKTFVQMSCSNPRSLLVVLGRAYSIAAFRGLEFSATMPLSVELQTDAAVEASHFMYESDTNYGSKSSPARQATARLATLLRTARYALNVPEVSPMLVSFSEDELTEEAKKVLRSALNYSFLFEASAGRPNRNNKRVGKKIQLNPLLAPKWGLPTKKGGDIALGKAAANAIFDPDQAAEFDQVLRQLVQKWNKPFSKDESALDQQADLFA